MVDMSKVHDKKLNFLAFTILILIITPPLLVLQPTAAQSTPYIEKSFSWNYEGKHWNWNLSIPQELYDAYKTVPVNTRTRNGPSGYGFLTTTQDYYVKMLAQKLNETTNTLGYGSYDQVSFVLAFVQSLPYTSDNVTEGYNEYPRFPIETLVDGGGDCEDTSILFATITLILGYGTVYINPTDHYAVGILGDNLRGTYWEYPQGSNHTYYYCETTGDGFKIGQLPEEFLGKNAFIYSIDESNQYVPDIAVSIPTIAPTPTKMPLTGSATPTVTTNPDDENPTAQTPRPLSFNLIAENPLLFVIILFGIVFSFVLALWSVRRPHHQNESSLPYSPELQETSEQTEDGAKKFCIYCGEPNKGVAVYCEKCGKQIS
jgi:hypothetical protein